MKYGLWLWFRMSQDFGHYAHMSRIQKAFFWPRSTFGLLVYLVKGLK